MLCYGLFLDDKEYTKALREAYRWGSCQFLRRLFVTILVSNSIERPDHVWYETREYLIDGILHHQRRITNITGKVYKNLYFFYEFQLLFRTQKLNLFFLFIDLELAIEELQNLALLQIEEILQSNKKSLKDYPNMPFSRHVVRSHTLLL